MRSCIDLMATAMSSASSGNVVMPGKHVIPLADESGFLGVMLGSCGDPKSYGLKAMSILPGNPSKGLQALQGVLLVFDSETGAPSGLIDAAEITAIRTAAVSGMATEFLARSDAKVAAVLGCGVQAASHLEAMLAVRDIEKFLVWGRSAEKSRAFCNKYQQRLGTPMYPVPTARDAVTEADVISTVTSSEHPIIKGEWVKPGTHINLVGSHDAQHRESDDELIASASIYADVTEFAVRDAGEIVSAIRNKRLTPEDIVGEIGLLVSGLCRGRESDDEVTVFKSLGLVAQDLAAAQYVMSRAEELQLGSVCDF